MAAFTEDEKTFAKYGAIVCAFCFTLVAVYYFTGFSGSMETSKNAILKSEESIKELDKEIKEYEHFLKVDHTDQKQKMEEAINKFKDMLPNKSETSGILMFLNENILKSNIYYRSIQPLKKVEYDLYLEQPIRLNLECGYWELVQLIRKIENAPRFMRVKNLKVKGKIKYRSRIKLEEQVQDMFNTQLDDENADAIDSIMGKLKKGQKISKEQRLKNLLGLPLQHSVTLDISTYVFKEKAKRGKS